MVSGKLRQPNGFVLIVFLILLAATAANAQRKCGTVEYEQDLQRKNPGRQTREQFEQWMAKKLSQRKLTGARTEGLSYTIPVVVHIIHNGVNDATNIPDAQVQSQIKALNRDFQRMNKDTTQTPAEFKPVAGSINVTFVLAKQDPEGLATTGITRTLGAKTSWTRADDAIFKGLSYWPAEDYLNFWVLNLNDNNIIGYSQLPTSSGLPGLESASNDRLTDGVAFAYRAFGDNTDGGNFNLFSTFQQGRTAVHECGHIFGLRHIWGDLTDSCIGDDYCADTPTQMNSTSGCPTQPAISCGHDKMFQNYMDYTDDACYNMFTKDQVSRMVTVLANSPRRMSLLTSKGLNDPTVVPLDLGLRNVVNPVATACGGTPITPTLEIRNYGTSKITTLSIQLKLNGSVVETKNFNVSLNNLEITNVSFTPVTLNEQTAYTLDFNIVSVNGTTDNNSANDLISASFTVPASIALPFVEPFTSVPANWQIVNPDGQRTWQSVTAPYTTSSNKAVYIDFYDYETEGDQDQLLSPVFDLSTATVATLKFDRAYATFSASTPDRLMVVISTSCDANNATTVFDKSGSLLATSATTTVAFVPKSSADWQTTTISLASFIGQSHVQIKFIGIGANGNNLYLDNVSVTTDSFTDVALLGLKSPAPVSCQDSPVPVISVMNNGSKPITGLTVVSVINTTTTVTETFSGFNLQTGQDIDLQLNAWTLKAGTNSIRITLQTTDTDVAPTNNSLNINQVVNDSRGIIPLRENFDGAYPEWTLVSPTQKTNWKSVATNSTDKGLSLEYVGFGNAAIGAAAWIVSPTLDFSVTTKASVFFDYSYHRSAAGTDRFQVLGSGDCGLTFPDVLFDQTSDSLAFYNGSIKKTSSAWAPQQDSDWKRQYVNLDGMTGKTDARIAFVFTNGDGNNFFIDNIEFFVDDSKTPLAITPHYAVYNNFSPEPRVTFNLPEAAPVHLQVYSILGTLVIDSELSNVLNQTYTVDLNGRSSGVYIMRIQIGTELGTAKVFVGN